jgi:integrase
VAEWLIAADSKSVGGCPRRKARGGQPSGGSNPTIAALLGHRKASVTARYAHHADAVLLQAADAVADRITELMGDARPAGVVLDLRLRAG